MYRRAVRRRRWAGVLCGLVSCRDFAHRPTGRLSLRLSCALRALVGWCRQAHVLWRAARDVGDKNVGPLTGWSGAPRLSGPLAFQENAAAAAAYLACGVPSMAAMQDMNPSRSSVMTGPMTPTAGTVVRPASSGGQMNTDSNVPSESQ